MQAEIGLQAPYRYPPTQVNQRDSCVLPMRTKSWTAGPGGSAAPGRLAARDGMNHQDFALLAGSFADAFTSGHIKWLGAGLGFIFGNHPVYFVHVGSCRIVFKKRGLGWTQIAFSIGQSSDGSFFTGARICSTVWFRAPPSFATIDLGGWDQQAPSQPLPPDTVRRTSAPRVPQKSGRRAHRVLSFWRWSGACAIH